MINRIFRLFISSTFSDFIAELEALQKNVFPRLEKFCAERGARFQAIDLRWGITAEAQQEHDTMRICLEEVRRCQQLSPRRNFAVLLGDRIPYASTMKTFLFLALCLATCIHAADLRGRVVSVSDGDTVTVLDAERHQHKVRLAGIDAPEKAQAFGQASKISLSDQIFGREVAVTWVKRDHFGRIVGKISVDHRDVCLEQVRRGMAWHYMQYARDQSPDDRGAYAEAEVAARAARAGLWQDVSPVAPWEWRHKK